MKINHDVKEYIEIHSTNWESCINQIADYISSSVNERTKRIIFQSNFGFMGNDVPCTILITKKENSENLFNVKIKYADWLMFNAETERMDKISSTWELNCPTDKEAIADWEDKSAFELFDMLNNYMVTKYEEVPLVAILYGVLVDFFVSEYDTRDSWEDEGGYVYDACMVILDKEEERTEEDLKWDIFFPKND